MSTPIQPASDAYPEAGNSTATAAPPRRPFYWSVRRELWENRSLYVAPLITAAVYLFAFFLGVAHSRLRGPSSLDPAARRAAMIMPYSMAATLIMFTAFLVALFYCLDALYGERRDRSILFWKSLPVSDLTTVLAKACIPLAVLPVVTTVIVFATQLVMVFLHVFLLAATGSGPSALWSALPLFQMSLIQPYGLAVHALWHAPIYAWLLLVSAWAKRTPVLWAVLPVAGIGMFERIVFDTSYFGMLLAHRVMGAMKEAFTADAASGGLITQLTQLTPGRFLTSAGLWTGLIVAAGFLAAAARLRRSRAPI
jgi:ABC-2 type transport system permease protein